MIKRSVGLTFLWGGLSLFSAVAVAQSTEAEPTSSAQLDRSLEEVNVFGRQHNLLGQSVSASEGVVGAKDIEVRPLLRTGEVLELVPGMVVTQHSGSGKANQYFLRGTNLDHGTDFSTFVDGMPVNMRSHGHGHALRLVICAEFARVYYQWRFDL